MTRAVWMVMMTPAAVARPQVAKKRVVTVATIARHSGGIDVGDDVGNAVLAQQRAHNLSDTTVTDNDGMPLPTYRTRAKFGIDSFAGSQSRSDPSRSHR